MTYVAKDGWLHWYSEAVSTQCLFGDEMDFKKSNENIQHQSSSINKTCSFQSNFLCGPASSSRAIPAGISMECIMIHNDHHKKSSSMRLSVGRKYISASIQVLRSMFCNELYIRPALVEWKSILSVTFTSNVTDAGFRFTRTMCLSHIGVAQECYIFLGTETFSLYSFRVVFSNVETVIWGDLTKNEGNDLMCFKQIWFMEKKGQVYGMAAMSVPSSRVHQMNGMMKKRAL